MGLQIKGIEDKTNITKLNEFQNLNKLQENTRKLAEEQIAKANQLTGRCTDSDGGKNYYAKGYSLGYYENLVNKRQAEDFCRSDKPNILGEQYCDGDVLKIAFFNCINGCKDGACK